MRSKLVEFLNL
jgi:hypothetical protein